MRARRLLPVATTRGLAGLLAGLVLGSAPHASAAQPDLLRDMSHAVDLCLNAIQTGDLTGVTTLEAFVPPNASRFSGRLYALGETLLIQLEPVSLEGPHPDYATGCRIGVRGTDNAGNIAIRSRLRRWAPGKIDEITTGHDARSAPRSPTNSTPHFFWCDPTHGATYAFIGADRVGGPVIAEITNTYDYFSAWWDIPHGCERE